MRDRALIKVVSEFFEAATRGAIAIVHKNVLPLNPGEPEKTHMWMYSNIFFSAATVRARLLPPFPPPLPVW